MDNNIIYEIKIISLIYYNHFAYNKITRFFLSFFSWDEGKIEFFFLLIFYASHGVWHVVTIAIATEITVNKTLRTTMWTTEREVNDL